MTNDISENSRWAGDFLKRKDEANYLTSYLTSRYQIKKLESGFVLAINADWGMGKTFLIERWSKDIEVSGNPVVNFNAWENDFTTEALIAFIAELDKSLKPFFEKIPAAKRLRIEWLKKARAIVIPTLKVAGFAALKHMTGLGETKINELYNTEFGTDLNNAAKDSESDEDAEDNEKSIDFKSTQEKLVKVVEEKLKDHINTRDAISSFKEKLAALIEQIEKDGVTLPIYIFIDELDRCRPDYAIRLLEGIKHLFGIPGLYFVIATNIQQLAHAIRAVYGSGFSSERYLKRFFDLEYSLSEPTGVEFYNNLMAPLMDLIHNPLITGLDQFMDMSSLPLKGLPYIFQRYADSFDLTLRDKHQVARILEAALISLNKDPVHIHFLFFLAALYQKNSAVYRTAINSLSLDSVDNAAPRISDQNKGKFKFDTWDGENARSQTVSCLEIARRYFNFLNSENSSITHITNPLFPDNIQRNLVRSSTPIGEIRKYVEIVRRAGHFS